MSALPILQPSQNQFKLSLTDARRAVMSLRKLCFYTMLAAILACAAVGRLNRDSKEFDVPEANAGRNDPSLAASFRPKSEMLPADFFPVQSKNDKNLGAGKLLVASRNLGDPHLAKTVSRPSNVRVAACTTPKSSRSSSFKARRLRKEAPIFAESHNTKNEIKKKRRG
jgi:hypothetical protein